MEELFIELTEKIQRRFGKFDEENLRFEKASNSDIARELGYSDAQFSRLMHQTATPKEYQRAIQNMDRILAIIQLKSELKNTPETGRRSSQNSFTWVLLALAACLIGYIVFDKMSNSDTDAEKTTEPARDYTLKWAFETPFVSPYLSLEDLPADCNCPCYKYQGKWKLKNSYKIPLFREKNGFHYLATEVTMYARCFQMEKNNGKVLEGYEYQKHEIWYDKRKLPIDSFINKDNPELNNFYQNLKFRKNTNFIKVATVHTLFRNEFRIDSSFIYRTGKVIGRDLEFVSTKELKKYIKDESVINDIQNALDRISRNLLEDFSKPVSCNAATLEVKDFNKVKEGAEMSFECQLTTHRVPINYTKTYMLTDQYIINDCIPREE